MDEIATAARGTHAAIAAEPADSHPLANLPGGDAGPDRVDAARYLVAWDDRVFDARKRARDGEDVAVADAARLDLDAHLAGAWLGHWPLYQLKGGVGLGNLDSTHGKLLFSGIGGWPRGR